MGDLSKNLSRKEIACKCKCGYDSMDIETVELFQALREYVGVPITPSSGARCATHNENIGGSINSYHVKARAIDCPLPPVKLQAAWEWLNVQYEGRYGFGKYKTFIHIDTRTDGPARWEDA